MPIAAAEQVLEERARLVAPAEHGEGVDEPERADKERVCRRAEVVVLDVAQDEVATAQLALDGDHRAAELRIVRAEKAHLVQPEQARGERVAPPPRPQRAPPPR